MTEIAIQSKPGLHWISQKSVAREACARCNSGIAPFDLYFRACVNEDLVFEEASYDVCEACRLKLPVVPPSKGEIKS